MLERYLSRFFPIYIYPQPDTLVIEDRRPSNGLLLLIVFAALWLLIAVVTLTPLIAQDVYWPVAIFLLPAPIFVIPGLLLAYGAEYIFDKGQDTYRFSRKSALKSSATQEGLLSQIRAVQIERRLLPQSDDGGTREAFRVVLLLQQGMLFGSPDTVPLREDTLFNHYESEVRIANAVAKFLDLPGPDTVTA